MDSTDEYLIDEILPKREIHLIAGPSGVGKSTWLLQFLDDWRNSKPIWNHASNPCPFAIISLDRSSKSMIKTFSRVGVVGVPYFDARSWDKSLESIVVLIKGSIPDIQLLVIEGFALLVPRSRNLDIYQRVGDFLTSAAKLIEKENLTIIGTVHSPKMKSNESYADARQRVLGSSAWAAMTDTIILVERSNADNPKDPHRQITLLPRNSAEEVYKYRLDSKGRFQEVEERETEDIMSEVLERLPNEFTTAQLLEEVVFEDISRATLFRWISSTLLVVKGPVRGTWKKSKIM